MNPYGNNYIFVGKKNTGKTHESLKLALAFRKGVYAKINKPIVIFDPERNRSFDQITKIVAVDYLAKQLKDGEIVKVQSDDIDTFCNYLTTVQIGCVINIDEAGTHFSGTLSESQTALLKSPKNKGHEIFYQYHYFNGGDMPPKVIKLNDIFVIKETDDDFNKLPEKVSRPYEIGYCLYMVSEMNKKLPVNQKWATIFYDKESDKVAIKKGVNDPEKLNWINGDDFFPKRKKGEFKL